MRVRLSSSIEAREKMVMYARSNGSSRSWSTMISACSPARTVSMASSGATITTSISPASSLLRAVTSSWVIPTRSMAGSSASWSSPSRPASSLPWGNTITVWSGAGRDRYPTPKRPKSRNGPRISTTMSPG